MRVVHRCVRSFLLVSLLVAGIGLAAQETDSQLRVFPTPSTNTVTDGTYGTIRMDAASPWTASGIQLLATDTAHPNIVAQIADASTGWFGVYASGQSAPLLKVFGNGNVVIGANGMNYARLEVWAPNASGTSGASAYKGFMLTNGVDSTLVLRTLGNGVAQIATDFQNRSLSFATGLFKEAMRIDGSGHVGIGMAAGNAPSILTVLGDTISGTIAHIENNSTFSGTQPYLVKAVENFTYHNVVAGATNNAYAYGSHEKAVLTGPGTLSQATGVRVDVGVESATGTGTVMGAYGVRINIDKNSGTITNGYGLYIEDVEATTAYGVYQQSANDTNYFAGSVGIGTGAGAYALNVQGDAHFSGNVTGGNIAASYQDIAEWVPATTDMAPGTVVVLNREHTNEVMPSMHAYDTAVAGVVSAQPGVILGRGDASKEQIATTGRVKVHVDANSAPIAIGDLLVSSDKPGTAMKSEPMQINGRTFHQPGTIIGKALEPLPSGEGEILVLLSLQ